MSGANVNVVRLFRSFWAYVTRIGGLLMKRLHPGLFRKVTEALNEKLAFHASVFWV